MTTKLSRQQPYPMDWFESTPPVTTKLSPLQPPPFTKLTAFNTSWQQCKSWKPFSLLMNWQLSTLPYKAVISLFLRYHMETVWKNNPSRIFPENSLSGGSQGWISSGMAACNDGCDPRYCTVHSPYLNISQDIWCLQQTPMAYPAAAHHCNHNHYHWHIVICYINSSPPYAGVSELDHHWFR